MPHTYYLFKGKTNFLGPMHATYLLLFNGKTMIGKTISEFECYANDDYILTPLVVRVSMNRLFHVSCSCGVGACYMSVSESNKLVF